MLLEPGGHYITSDSEFRARPGDYVYQKCKTAKYRYDDCRAVSFQMVCPMIIQRKVLGEPM